MKGKPRVVIVGSGLGGAFAAHGLAQSHDVTVVEVDGPLERWQRSVIDVGAPAQLDPHVGAGLGGTTALWFNGLIEIDEGVFARRWPFPKSELDPFYAEAFQHLSGGVAREVAEATATRVRERHAREGVHADRIPFMFCPIECRNAWECLAVQDRVRLVRGEVVGFDTDGRFMRGVKVLGAGGLSHVEADVVILAAGGLGTPLLLQALAREVDYAGARHAGCFYEDHPMTFVAELTLRRPLYRLWNAAVPRAAGNLRLPLVIDHDGLHVSFQVRPAATYFRESRRRQVRSVITAVRSRPFSPMSYLRLLRHRDDIVDILSFRFGIQLPTTHYTLLMVAEQPARAERSVWGEHDAGGARTAVYRRWDLSPDYLATLEAAAARFIEAQGDLVESFRFLPEWKTTLATAAHHSGTARMAATPDAGVCDANGRVHGLDNLYVADGSAIPASGIANTGLTIAALSLRLAAHLRTAVGARA